MRMILTALLLVAAAACEDTTNRPPPESDVPVQPGIGGLAGGRSDDGGLPTRADGGSTLCTDLTTNAPVIDEVGVVSDPPSGTGGAIVDGTYDLTDARVYQGAGGLGGPTGDTYQGSIRISNTGTKIEQVVLLTTSAGTAETKGAGTLSVTGTNAVLAFNCPQTVQQQVTFTATDTTLVVTNLVTKESFSYTKKP